VAVLPGSRLSLVAVASGSGRPGLLRGSQGGLACLASTRIRGRGPVRPRVGGS
jgi:hypothetical protein